MEVDAILMTLFVLVAPYVAQVGAIGSDKWRPKARGLLKGKVGQFAVRWMNSILLVNGVLFAAAYLAWQLIDGPYFVIPLVIAIPTVVLQVGLAAESSRQSTFRHR